MFMHPHIPWHSFLGISIPEGETTLGVLKFGDPNTQLYHTILQKNKYLICTAGRTQKLASMFLVFFFNPTKQQLFVFLWLAKDSLCPMSCPGEFALFQTYCSHWLIWASAFFSLFMAHISHSCVS